MSNKEYFVSKLSFREDERLIRDVTVYEYDGSNLDAGTIQNRQWMVNKAMEDYQISIITPSPDKKNKWTRHDTFTYEGGYFRWAFKLPLNETKRKTFLSYYHRDDQDYRTKYENILET